MARAEDWVIHTDGACDPNPGPGGWAAILRHGGDERVLSGGERETTNNRMELTAALQALRALPAGAAAEIHTDSEYLQRGISEWLPAWKDRGWKRKGGRLANLELWQALDAALAGRRISWHWLPGHSGHALNTRADRLARQAIPH